MKPLRRIEVEPLGDHRWAKIERSVLESLEREAIGGVRPPEPRRRIGVRAGLTVAAAIVAGAVGATVLLQRGQPEHAALESPSRITTGASASHLALPGLALDVAPQSAVVVGSETPQGLLIVLDQGSIVCDVAPRSGKSPLIVQAGATRVRVVGTRFSVTRSGEAARVKVDEGIVEVLAAGGRWRVAAGEDWPPAETAEPKPAPLALPPTDSLATPPSVAPESPKSTEPTQGKQAARQRALATPDRRTPVAPEAVTPETPPPPSPQSVFEEAAASERSDPARASQLYRTLESGAGSWAQHALYARGRLEASRGNRTEARRLLERYLERYPNGSNAEDARAVLRRLL
jgi:hypothetical protein